MITVSLDYLSQDLSNILSSLDKVSYERATKVQNGEKAFADVYRVKKRGEGWTDPLIEKTLKQPAFTEHLKQLTNKESINIDRCQVHKYTAGGSIMKYTDTDTHADYTHTILIGLTDTYEGGEFRVHYEDGLQTKKALKDDMIICPSNIPHDVTKIESGLRIVIVFFLN